MPEHFERMPVETVEAVFGAQPQESLLVLLNTKNRVVRQAVLYLVMPEIVFLGVGGVPGVERKKEQYEYSFFQRGGFVRRSNIVLITAQQ